MYTGFEPKCSHHMHDLHIVRRVGSAMYTGFQPLLRVYRMSRFSETSLCFNPDFISLHLFIKSILKEFTSYKGSRGLEMMSDE